MYGQRLKIKWNECEQLTDPVFHECAMPAYDKWYKYYNDQTNTTNYILFRMEAKRSECMPRNKVVRTIEIFSLGTNIAMWNRCGFKQYLKRLVTSTKNRLNTQKPSIKIGAMASQHGFLFFLSFGKFKRFDLTFSIHRGFTMYLGFTIQNQQGKKSFPISARLLWIAGNSTDS